MEIETRPLIERKTTAYLSQVIREICSDWAIQYSRVKLVVTDGGANIKAAAKEEFGANKHVTCFAYIINGICQRSIGLSAPPKPPSEQTAGEMVVNIPDNESDHEGNVDEPEEPSEDISGAVLFPKELVKKVKKIVKFFHSSEIATASLNQLQKTELNRRDHECLKHIQETPIRWNSCFDMIDL